VSGERRAGEPERGAGQQLVLSPSTRASHRTSCTVDSLGCFCTAPSPRSRHRRRSRLRPRRRLILISPCRVNPPQRSGTSLVAFCDSSRHPADVSLCPQQASRPRRVLRRASCAPSLAPPPRRPSRGHADPSLCPHSTHNRRSRAASRPQARRAPSARLVGRSRLPRACVPSLFARFPVAECG